MHKHVLFEAATFSSEPGTDALLPCACESMRTVAPVCDDRTGRVLTYELSAQCLHGDVGQADEFRDKNLKTTFAGDGGEKEAAMPENKNEKQDNKSNQNQSQNQGKKPASGKQSQNADTDRKSSK